MPQGKPQASMEGLIEFLRKNVLGKTIFSEETLYDLDLGRLEGAYSTEITYANLMLSETGFTVDGFVVSHEKIRGVGNPKVLIKDARMVSIFTYEFSKRLSTGEVTGLMRFVSSSAAAAPSPAEATVSSLFGLTMKEDEIGWKKEQVMYRDQLNMSGSYSPKAFVSDNFLRIRGGKLEYGFTAECYTVNPKTFERKKDPGYFTPFVARER